MTLEFSPLTNYLLFPQDPSHLNPILTLDDFFPWWSFLWACLMVFPSSFFQTKQWSKVRLKQAPVRWVIVITTQETTACRNWTLTKHRRHPHTMVNNQKWFQVSSFMECRSQKCILICWEWALCYIEKVAMAIDMDLNSWSWKGR